MLFAVTLALLIAATALLVSSALRRIKSASAETVAGESLYREVMDRAVREHVDPIDAESAVYGAVKGLVSELDPHSRVFDAAEWADFQRESRGETIGIGLEIEEIDGALIVAWVSPGSPADLASIRAGDRILAAGATPASSGRAAVLAALEGKRGSRIGLHLDPRRAAESAGWRSSARRSTSRPSHVRKLSGGILYARISAFRPRTAEAFDRAVRDAGQEARNGVVLDLRFNRGGSFEAAVAVADAWLSRGAIVRTKGPTQDESREATPDAPLEAVPTVVLVNWATASAAEVVAAALQDTQAGILVGERTFGKGVVQEVVEFESWPGGMKLTTGRLFSPAGRCVDRGVRPSSGETVAWGSSRISSSRCRRWILATLERTLERDRYPDWMNARRAAGSRSDPQLEAALDLVAGKPADSPLTR